MEGCKPSKVLVHTHEELVHDSVGHRQLVQGTKYRGDVMMEFSKSHQRGSAIMIYELVISAK